MEKERRLCFPRAPATLNCTRGTWLFSSPTCLSPPTQPVNSPHQICPNEGSPLRSGTPGSVILAILASGSGLRPPSQVALRRSRTGHPLFPSPPGAPPHTLGGRATRRPADPARAQPSAESPRRKRSGRSMSVAQSGPREPAHQSAPGQHDAGPPADLPLTRASVPGPLSDALSLGKARPSAFNNSPGKKPAPAHPPAQELENGTPPRQSENPTESQKDTGRAQSVFPLFPRAGL